MESLELSSLGGVQLVFSVQPRDTAGYRGIPRELGVEKNLELSSLGGVQLVFCVQPRDTAGYREILGMLQQIPQFPAYPDVGRKKLVVRPPDCLTLGFFLRPVPAVSRGIPRYPAVSRGWTEKTSCTPSRLLNSRHWLVLYAVYRGV